MPFDFSILAKLVEVFWINLVLSGDNAILIALACHNLPMPQRRLGMILGSISAIALRLVFSLLAMPLLAVTGLKLSGAVLLVWIAASLIEGEEKDLSGHIESHDLLWRAVRAIALADLVLSLDNVLVIVGIAHDMPWMLAFGLVLSIPLIVWGSGMIGTLVDRFPVLLYLGAGMIGWSAGELSLSDPFVADDLKAITGPGAELIIPAVTAAMAIGGGLIRRKWLFRRHVRSENS